MEVIIYIHVLLLLLMVVVDGMYIFGLLLEDVEEGSFVVGVVRADGKGLRISGLLFVVGGSHLIVW